MLKMHLFKLELTDTKWFLHYLLIYLEVEDINFN